MGRITNEDDQNLIKLIAQGMSDRQCAESLNMPYHTVRWRIQRLMRNMDVHSRHDIVAYDRENRDINAVRPDIVSSNLSQKLARWAGIDALSDAVTDAFNVAFAVRTGNPVQVRAQLRRWRDNNPDRVTALVLALGALVPLDQRPEELLRWLRHVDRPNNQPTTGQIGNAQRTSQ